MKPTLLHIVPTLAQLFINHPALKMESFERVHTIFSSAALLGQQTAVRVLDKFKNYNLLVQEGALLLQFISMHNNSNKK